MENQTPQPNLTTTTTLRKGRILKANRTRDDYGTTFVDDNFAPAQVEIQEIFTYTHKQSGATKYRASIRVLNMDTNQKNYLDEECKINHPGKKLSYFGTGFIGPRMVASAQEALTKGTVLRCSIIAINLRSHDGGEYVRPTYTIGRMRGVLYRENNQPNLPTLLEDK